MNVFYIYILYSPSSDKYYVGSTENPWRRLWEHNHDPKSTYTSKHRPWILKAMFEAGFARSEAVKVERFIKKQKSKTLLKKLIDQDFKPEGKLAHLVRVPHVRD